MPSPDTWGCLKSQSNPSSTTMAAGRASAATSTEYGLGRKGARRRPPSLETWELLRGQHLPGDFEEQGLNGEGGPITTPHEGLVGTNAEPLKQRAHNDPAWDGHHQRRSEVVHKMLHNAPLTPRRIAAARLERIHTMTRSAYFEALASGRPGTPPRSPSRHPMHQAIASRESLVGTSLPGCMLPGTVNREVGRSKEWQPPPEQDLHKHLRIEPSEGMATTRSCATSRSYATSATSCSPGSSQGSRSHRSHSRHSHSHRSSRCSSHHGSHHSSRHHSHRRSRSVVSEC